jgi:hypothetical protein
MLIRSLELKNFRWVKRRDAWGGALHALSRLRRRPSNEMRAPIVDTATSTGFFSVWLTVFGGDADRRLRFLKAFLGTSGIRECFDANAYPIQRPGGAI